MRKHTGRVPLCVVSAEALDTKIDAKIRDLDSRQGEECLRAVAELLHALDERRALLQCGIDALRAPYVTPWEA